MDSAKLRTAAFVAGVAYAAEAPHLYYLARIAHPAALEQRYPSMTIEQILGAELVRVALLAVLAALAGALWGERNGLAGLGDRRRLVSSWPWILAGLVASAGIYFAFGREVAGAAPERYPCALGWAAVIWLKSALFDEVIARFGMMTVVAGVVRRGWAANLIQAVFFSAVGVRALVFTGASPAEGAALLSLGSSFLVHLACGWVYANRGLFASMGVHAAFSTRFLIHAAGCS